MSTRRISLNGDWLYRVDSRDEGLAQHWHSQPATPEAWQAIKIPNFWEFHGIDSDPGIRWYQRTFDLPQTDAEQLGLCLAGIDCHASVWLNGQKIESESPVGQRFAARVGGHLKIGANTLSIRVADHGRPGSILTSAWLGGAGDLEALLHTTMAEQHARPSADWVRSAVIYEAYLRSASPEGTFRGLQNRLDDLRRMGVSVIWLMPIHPIGKRNRKGQLGSPYAIRDYFATNPEFGTLDDFKDLLAATHERGMRLVIDLVLNHTAWDCPLLKEHADWYAHDDEGNIRAPFDEWSDVAQLDYRSPELTRYMTDMMAYWVRDIGIDGFRCDVAGLVPDHVWDQARPALDATYPVLMLAEDDQPHQHLRAFDLTYDWFTYRALGRLPAATLRAGDLETLLVNERYDYPRGSLRLRFSSNHDLCAWHKPARARYGPDAARVAAALTFALPGVPLIYTGQEIANATVLPLFERVSLDWRHAAHHNHFAFYAALARLRRDHEALRSGVLEFADTGNERVLGIRRVTPSETVLILLNLADAEVELPLDVTRWTAAKTLLGLTRPTPDQASRQIVLPPFGTWIGQPRQAHTTPHAP